MGISPAPLVSVVVPVWNAEPTLMETLRSVADQTYRNLEILIVDDGSTDGSAGIAADFCRAEPRARLFRQQNGGVAAARNLAIGEASGCWIAPIDADDLWHSGKIEKQVAAALAAPVRPGIVYCWYHYVDAGGRVIGSRTGWVANGPAFRQLAYDNFVGNGSAPLLWRPAVEEAGGYDPQLRACDAQGCEDLLLQLLIARRHPVACVPEHLVGYRVQAGTMSRDAAQMRRSWALLFERLEASGSPVPAQVRNWTLGVRTLEFAETSAIGREWGEALRLLGRAVRLDPVRCGALLGYRAARLARKLVGGRRAIAERPPFSAADPNASYSLDPDALPRLAQLVGWIDRRRLARLAAEER